MKHTFDKFEQAQEILGKIYDGHLSSGLLGGFHIRLYGGTYFDLNQHADKIELYGGFDKASEMINEGRIFYVYPFKCENSFCPSRFQYGGGWACNTCGTCINEPNWWKIKVMLDGDMFICIGNGFVNLQESNNYSFGKTKEEAIQEYWKLAIKNKWD